MLPSTRPIIDILLAVYNSSAYLHSQLQSLMTQTYPHFHIIARDDCSSDNSHAILTSYATQHPGKITVLQGKENLGAKGNFSALAEASQADYIFFCDADDVWLPTKVEDSLSLMRKNEALHSKDHPILVHTDLAVVDRNLQTICPSFWSYSKLNPHTADRLNRLLIQNVITGCTLLINKPLLHLARPIPKEAVMHDWWIGLTASAFGTIDFLNKPTLLYRQHEKNDVGAKNWKSLKTYWQALRKLFFSKGRSELRRRLSQTIQQAALFSERYGEELPSHLRRVIKDYARLDQADPIEKRYLLLKGRYFKNGLAKTAATFLLI